MKLLFTLKALGKKKAYLHQNPIELNLDPNSSVQAFLEEVVWQQVQAYNARKTGKNLVSFFDNDALNERVVTGKVGFNDVENTTLANADLAVQTVLQSFEDGLIALFVNEEPCESLDQSLLLSEMDEIIIVKLTFLAGSFF